MDPYDLPWRGDYTGFRYHYDGFWSCFGHLHIYCDRPVWWYLGSLCSGRYQSPAHRSRPAGCHQRPHAGLPGLNERLQHIFRFRSHILHLDPALGMDRELNHQHHQCHSRCHGRYYFRKSLQQLRSKLNQNPVCFCFFSTLTTGNNRWSQFSMRGFVQYIQYLLRTGGQLLYLDIAIGMEWRFNLYIDHRYGR